MTVSLENIRASRKREALSVSPLKIVSGSWRCGDYLLDYEKQPLIMGILNVTPDSFSDGGHFLDLAKAIDHALALEACGADLIDIGGESTRPGALSVSLEEEKRRVLPVIRALAKRIRIPLSVDTRKSEVAREAVAEGAAIINDVSGLSYDREMLAVAAKGQTGLVLMHAKGTPETMQNTPSYQDVVDEIYEFMRQSLSQTDEAKISRDRIAIDPGIGFGKTTAHNLTIIHKLKRLTDLGVPVLFGPSRKSFIGELLGGLPPGERTEGTAAAVAIATMEGARIFRVHDVKSMKRVALVAEGIRKEKIRNG